MESTKQKRCGTHEVHLRLLKEYPEYAKNRREIELFTAEYVKRYAACGLRAGVVRIPVVVHVVYNTSAQNISDAQINSQIDVLNEDFRKLNTNTVPEEFQSVAADARIEFQLAKRDPDCQATTGITRTSTTVTSFSSDDAVKSASTGGHDPWPRNKYLNIWVCNMPSPLGYAQFPGGPAATDGVVITYTAFGDTGTAAAPYGLGRTATHEIGHWLNLIHIWGTPGCSNDDGVTDTPKQDTEYYGVPTHPQTSCGSHDMFMNFMDYVDDDCMALFSAGQVARMDACLNEPRSSILGSDGLIPPTGVPGSDLWSQNTPQDVGDEPDDISPNMWRSDDIWVRRQNDGLTNQEHENPEYKTSGSNYVYVRIRNRGCVSQDSAEIKLYWAKASTALGWPAPWDGSVTSPVLMGGLIGSQASGNVQASDFVILEFPWSPPNPDDYSSFGAQKSHFCLLSRIETSSSPPYGMTTTEGPNLGSNVRNNNNIVWKNITIVGDSPDGGRSASLIVGNIGKKAHPAKFVFSIPKDASDHVIFDWEDVNIHLERDLYAKWRKGGSKGEGIASRKNGTIRLKGHQAWIGNIMLQPNEFHNLGVSFVHKKKRRKEYGVYSLNITQYQSEGKKDRFLGGQTLIFKSIPRKNTKG